MSHLITLLKATTKDGQPVNIRFGKYFTFENGALRQVKSVYQHAFFAPQIKVLEDAEDLVNIINNLQPNELITASIPTSGARVIQRTLNSGWQFSSTLTLDIDGTIPAGDFIRNVMRSTPEEQPMAVNAAAVDLRTKLLALMEESGVISNNADPDMIVQFSASFSKNPDYYRAHVVMVCTENITPKLKELLGFIKIGFNRAFDLLPVSLGAHITFNKPFVAPSDPYQNARNAVVVRGSERTVTFNLEADIANNSQKAPTKQVAATTPAMKARATQRLKDAFKADGNHQTQKNAIFSAAFCGLTVEEVFAAIESVTTLDSESVDYDVALDFMDKTHSSLPRNRWLSATKALQAAGVSFEEYVDWCAKGDNFTGEDDCRNAWDWEATSPTTSAAVLYSIATEQEVKLIASTNEGWTDYRVEQVFNRATNYSPNNLPVLRRWVNQVKQEGRWLKQQFVSDVLIEDFPFGSAVVLKSSHGTGKTAAVEKLLKKTVDSGKTFLYITTNTHLCAATSKRLGCANYESFESDIPQQQALVITLKSFWKVRNHHYDVIVIDEVEQLWGFLFSDIMTKESHIALQQLLDAVELSELTVFCDAGIEVGAATGKFLELCGKVKETERGFDTSKVVYIENLWVEARDVFMINDATAAKLAMKTLIEETPKQDMTYFAQTTEAGCEVTSAELDALGVPHLVITRPRREVDAAAIEDFFVNPSKAIENNGYKAVVYNSACATGVDIQKAGRVVMVVDQRDSLGSEEVVQMMRRCRHPQQTWVLNNFNGVNRSTLAKHYIQQAEDQKNVWREAGFVGDYNLSHITDLKERHLRTETLKFAAEVEAFTAGLESNLKEGIRSKLVQSGANVRVVWGEGGQLYGDGELVALFDGKSAPQQSSIAASVRSQRSTAKVMDVVNAENITNEKAKTLIVKAANTELSFEERTSLDKWNIQQVLGRENITPAEVKAAQNGAAVRGERLAATQVLMNDMTVATVKPTKLAQRIHRHTIDTPHRALTESGKTEVKALLGRHILSKLGVSLNNPVDTRLDYSAITTWFNTEESVRLVAACGFKPVIAEDVVKRTNQLLNSLLGIEVAPVQTRGAARSYELKAQAIQAAKQWAGNKAEALAAPLDPISTDQFNAQRKGEVITMFGISPSEVIEENPMLDVQCTAPTAPAKQTQVVKVTRKPKINTEVTFKEVSNPFEGLNLDPNPIFG